MRTTYPMNSLLTAKSTIEEILQSHPQAKEVMASVQLINCHKCAVRFDESLQEASDNYGFDLMSILQQLINGLLKFEKSKSFIAKKLSSSFDNQIDNIANILEERAQWQKFGL